MYIDPGMGSSAAFQAATVFSVCGALLAFVGGVIGTVLYFLRKGKKK
jgi:hypothetical protein